MSPSPRRSETLIDLRGGFPRAGLVQRQAALQGIARNTQAIWSVDFTQSLEHVVTSLLSIASPELEWTDLHSLPLTDRHAMVRAVWLLDGGGPARAEAECHECGEWVEFELDLRSIPVPGGCDVLTVHRNEEERACCLPTPLVTEAANDGVDVAAACLQCSREEAEPWVDAVEEALSQNDLLGEILLVGPCVSCGRTLQTEFDLKSAWAAWMRGIVRRLMADVHTLARNYHWSEDEILRIPEARRAVYLNFCDVEEPVEA
ncbi:hypothetical protein [uncultured Paludibaculum sp.]|uniref:hypothetical protein n=1 Tax=uncultured Paludibaculum sp. TaxID=1765020 RepID=UPI002AAA983D|nr:hypothetical protein [uncultured Paludibaculum sp.]